MQKLLAICYAVFLVAACEKYDDSWIKDEFADVDGRLDELEKKCKEINTEIVNIQELIKALQQNDFVTDVKQLKENGKVVGYEICFSKNESVRLYHGKDGVDAHVPQISVKQDADGIWYWTVDGEWMKDAEGNKVSTLGREDLVPQMKIENEYWYISYDNGATWTMLSKAVGEDGKDGEDGKSFFKEVQYDAEYVYITLMDGTVVKMPKMSDLDINFDRLKEIPCSPGQTLQLPYYLSGAVSSVELITICEGNWNATVKKTDETSGYIMVYVPESIDESQILVAVSDSRKTVMKTLTFVAGVFSVADSYILSDDGGELSISISTNYDYNITTNASWITSVETKAIRNESIVVKYESLPSGTITRSAEILFKNDYLGLIKSITLIQGSPVSLSSKALQMIVGEEYTLSASSLVGHSSFVWYSSDSDIVRVNNDGKLTAISKGTATITAMTSDFTYSAKCVVTVSEISDLITTKFGSASISSYIDGVLGAGSKLSWYIYNNSSSSIVVNYIQVNDSATGFSGNKMAVNATLSPGNNTGWTISLGMSCRAPYCRFYFTYNGKEYTQDCASMFN